MQLFVSYIWMTEYPVAHKDFWDLIWYSYIITIFYTTFSFLLVKTLLLPSSSTELLDFRNDN